LKQGKKVLPYINIGGANKGGRSLQEEAEEPKKEKRKRSVQKLRQVLCTG
jgi:hypothetical protein